jgi:hypothetical protein
MKFIACLVLGGLTGLSSAGFRLDPGRVGFYAGVLGMPAKDVPAYLASLREQAIPSSRTYSVVLPGGREEIEELPKGAEVWGDAFGEPILTAAGGVIEVADKSSAPSGFQEVGEDVLIGAAALGCGYVAIHEAASWHNTDADRPLPKPQTVPEPGPFLVLGFGVLSVLGRAVRRRKG